MHTITPTILYNGQDDVNGYLSGQDRPGIAHIVPAKEKFFGIIFWPYNKCKSFIDQACSVKMAGYWPCSFCVFMDLNFVSVHKNAKRTWSISSHLDLMLGQ